MSLITPDFGLLFWMTLIFAIVLFIVAKFGFPMITGMVDKRNDRIREAIAKAREAEESLSNLAQSQQKIIEDTKKEQARILKEASATADTIVAGAKQRAQEEAEYIVADAKAKIEADKQAALRDVSSQIADISLKISEKILMQNLSADNAQRDLAGRLVDEYRKGENN